MGLLCVAASIAPAPARAQTAAPAPAPQAQNAGAPVNGRVICADTQHAARFALVTLIAATEDQEAGFGGAGRGGRVSARTDLDGNFNMPSVPPGEYFVTGQLTGYINQAAAVQAALNPSTTSTSTIPADVPKIRVGSGGASAQLSLQRGAVVAGSVQWDDGSPAAGVQVSVVAPPTTGSTGTSAAGNGLAGGFGGGFGPGGNFGGGGAQTDDRGHFRLSGLAAGAYLVRANVQAPAPAAGAGGDRRGFLRTLNLSVYAPDKLRRTDAATVTLAPGEERNDVIITMKLNALHSISGSIGSSAAPVRSGTVSITDQSDSSLTRSGTVNADGTFTVPYVPAGNYTLSANASTQSQTFGRPGAQASTGSTPAVRFQPLQESLTVTDTDLTGLSLNVTPVTAATSTTPSTAP